MSGWASNLFVGHSELTNLDELSRNYKMSFNPWLSALDYAPNDDTQIQVRYRVSGEILTEDMTISNSDEDMMKILKNHPNAEFRVVEPASCPWTLIANLPTETGYYLCKGKNCYAVEYFDGKKFSHSDSGWIKFWKPVES